MTNPEKLQSLSPVRLLLGYDKEGNFSSTLIETKEQFVVAIDKYVDGKVFKLTESQNLEWYRTQVKKYKKLKER